MEDAQISKRVPADDYITRKLDKLQYRIKNTATTRFAAAKRVRLNYDLGALTIVILSMWAIAISVILSTDSIPLADPIRNRVEFTGILLPVFIVVFSLLEGGNNYLRSHQLEQNARQLRELADELAGEITKEIHIKTTSLKAELFEKFSMKYNDTLERSPINHDDVDYYSKHYTSCRDESGILSPRWIMYAVLSGLFMVRRQLQRITYLSLWLVPIVPFLIK